MKRMLYLTNIPVPYRVRFFNELAKHCDLTVFYESRSGRFRDKAWLEGEKSNYPQKYLRDIPTLLCGKFDLVVIGCYTSAVQILLMLLFRLRGILCWINLDGEGFFSDNSWKSRCKRLLLSGAGGYFVAGDRAAETLGPVAGNKPVCSYRFSSLTREEVENHRALAGASREDSVLVVGQYFPYKGLDVALKAAAMDLRRPYLFVGMGSRTEKFLRDHPVPPNVTVIPFLQKEALEALYRRCGALVLPSRRECWGLVAVEAASFGMPVVSTWGSGAAAELLAEAWPEFLARPGDAQDLHRCIVRWFSSENQDAYRAFLLRKAADYHIEENVQAHLRGLRGETWSV